MTAVFSPIKSLVGMSHLSRAMNLLSFAYSRRLEVVRWEHSLQSWCHVSFAQPMRTFPDLCFQPSAEKSGCLPAELASCCEAGIRLKSCCKPHTSVFQIFPYFNCINLKAKRAWTSNSFSQYRTKIFFLATDIFSDIYARYQHTEICRPKF